MLFKWIIFLFKSVVLIVVLVIFFVVLVFIEGIDYMVLEKLIFNVDKMLIKVFSYVCFFCYKYDKVVIGLVFDKVVDFVMFILFYLEIKGEYGKQVSEVFVVLIVKDKVVGILLFDVKL